MPLSGPIRCEIIAKHSSNSEFIRSLFFYIFLPQLIRMRWYPMAIDINGNNCMTRYDWIIFKAKKNKTISQPKERRTPLVVGRGIRGQILSYCRLILFSPPPTPSAKASAASRKNISFPLLLLVLLLCNCFLNSINPLRLYSRPQSSPFMLELSSCYATTTK